MKLLISGGTGFIGEAIARAALVAGHSLRILTRSAYHARKLFPKKEVEIVEGDITKRETLPPSLEGIETVIQAAQFPGHPVENKRKGYTYFNIDARGTENLAKEAKTAGVKHFIYISGAGTNGDKKEPWFKAKWFAEQAIHSTGIPATVFRCSWVYGPKDKSLNRILGQLKFSPVLPVIGNGKNRVQPLFVEDLAQLVIAALESTENKDLTFDAGGPEELTMKEMLKKGAALSGKKRPAFLLPKFLVKLGAGFLEHLPSPPLSKKAIDFITMDTHIDVEPLKKAFPNIKLKTFEEGFGSYANLKK